MSDNQTLQDHVEDLMIERAQLNQDNLRAWQRVAELEAQLKECSAELNRLSSELARTYE
jgi:septal ring factor EnvC (AmiA/AmiB activator)